MKVPWLAGALGLIAVSNVWVLAHAAINRSAVDSEIELTARELAYFGGASEDSRVTFTLTYQNPGDWFDRKKLDELGFDTSVPPGSLEASRHYQNARSRPVWVALEYDGPAWRQWMKQREAQPETNGVVPTQDQRIEIDRQTASRLVIVDAGLDPESLRTKYPNRKQVVILAGLARVSVVYPPALRGNIDRISTAAIDVPASLRGKFDSRSYYSPYTYEKEKVTIHPPPFAVTVKVGSKYEPWVEDIRKLP